MDIKFEHKIFQFKTPSGTSRGILTEKQAWFIQIMENGKIGLGECSVIPGLSPDYESIEQYEKLLSKLRELASAINLTDFEGQKEYDLLTAIKEKTRIYSDFEKYPSLLFGFESAVLNWSAGKSELYFDTPFYQGEQKIPINGLVWMGSPDFMKNQIADKVELGFNCIKMKVGAINFESEIELLSSIRNAHPKDKMILRVDANGAFTKENVHERLTKLAQLDLHSIEQPIAPNQHESMADLCLENILPIALDEELIGIHSKEDKIKLLDNIKPQYIILKPSLHGGILGSKEWIELAKERNIDWWMTSALESNLGLACIAQFTSKFPIDKHHGLGTGSLYLNNTESRLKVESGEILFK